ncbi:hypothetical protein PENSOL_c068G04123 [Penicillium solitum]|uniref:Zn(2)-C6 fungal-type domain-containing protein n=1 Tax=Penicillium solitum TaxID=60172 RepID=A0A1V6QIS1_9EURO|nr:uncharacterized protein PENSOL_c068G04123 [Penicillium solitum]OQD89110.1 hypothetical protein PENSOL_c068G04123 [Penicillium solitum]
MESPLKKPKQHRDTGRPYRSKRHPPCDQCRRKKLRCEADEGQSCQRCQSNSSPCSFTFSLHPSFLPNFGSVSDHQEVEHGNGEKASPVTGVDQFQTMETPTCPESTINFDSNPINDPAGDFLLPLQPGYPLPERPTPQAIQTLDYLKGVSSQLIGASGESDPWLLRHCKFDEHGFLLFHQVHFRNAGGVPREEKIPVHFLVTGDELYDAAKETTRYPNIGSRRDELNSLVPLECGQRLVSLFLRFIFPTLPIISRSKFGFTPSHPIPDTTVLQNIPTHLLAAIYALAQPFTKFDEYLSIINVYTTPPTDRLWRITFEMILEEIHTPHLATLQAGLLYLHKQHQGSQTAVADSPFVWSFVGMLVGLATSLGLQLECRPMGLPAWERRLRRRLWWALYSEDKWRSLLMGRPPYIRNDEWDVTDLDDDDFRIDTEVFSLDHQAREAFCAIQFQGFARLFCLADEVQQRLFSLRAAQRLSSNFPESLATARSLLTKLKEWYFHLSPNLRHQNKPFPRNNQSDCLHFTYILLEVFIFRALLRPMVRSAAPPRLFEEPQDSLEIMVDDYIAHIISDEEIDPVPAIDNDTGNAVLKAAENCAASMLRSVLRMPCDLSAFWFSWCRIGFATVSSFMMLLVIQAPSKEHAIRARKLVDMWRQALVRGQCQMMDLALVRLNGPHWMGLTRNFFLPNHVREAIECTEDQ